MRIEELDYDLPSGLIAQRPPPRRDSSRLLVVRARAGEEPPALEDRAFRDLPRLLQPEDVLVRNDTRVLAARTHFRRPTGGTLELLFLEPARAGDGSRAGEERWEVLVRGRLREGETVASFAGSQTCTAQPVADLGGGRWLVDVVSPSGVTSFLREHGETPLPPYIRRRLHDPERYQTVYASVEGSAAAPTAGLHFTERLTGELWAKGVAIEDVTLHVGLATFKPVSAGRVEDHSLHEEAYTVERETWERVRAARRAGGHVIAVGTTTVRLLEELALLGDDAWRTAADGALCGRTSLFITPGHRFRVVDAMITNLHLPRTSLLALVMAFCGIAATRAAYRHAVTERYRFYSFGDAMLIWPPDHGHGS
jgi:S-adenosylmethionine:tRNA ribosyltransferase-isomerase